MYWEELKLPAPAGTAKPAIDNSQSGVDERHVPLIGWIDNDNFKPNPALISDDIQFCENLTKMFIFDPFSIISYFAHPGILTFTFETSILLQREILEASFWTSYHTFIFS